MVVEYADVGPMSMEGQCNSRKRRSFEEMELGMKRQEVAGVREGRLMGADHNQSRKECLPSGLMAGSGSFSPESMASQKMKGVLIKYQEWEDTGQLFPQKQ
jgi:hypothetical protein